MPLAFIEDAAVETRGSTTTLTYRQSQMDRMGKAVPVGDDRLSVTTTYTLKSHRLTRKDVFVAKQPLDVAAVRIEFAGFSTDPRTFGNTTVFGGGSVTVFQVNGLDACEARSLDRDPDYESDTRAMTSLVTCASGPSTIDGTLTITWSISYR
jgi:hypothetical protein